MATVDSSFILRNMKILTVKEIIPQSKFKVMARNVRLYKSLPNDKNMFNLARFTTMQLLGKTLEYQDVPVHVPSFSTVLYPYQQEICNYIQERLETPPHACLLKLGTGRGKTMIGTYITSILQQKTLIICPTKHITEQWIDEINKQLGDKTAGIYNQKKPNSVDIIVVNSARNMDNYDGYGFVIFDEVHEYTSTCNKEVLWKATNSKYLLGLTATPDTGNGLLPFLEAHLGEVYEGNVEDTPIDAVVRIIKYNTSEQYSEPVLSKLNMVNTMGTINRILEDKSRLNVVVQEIMFIYNLRDHKHHIFAFAEMRNYLDAINVALKSLHVESLIEADETSILRGGVTKDMIEEANDSRIILTTYGYSRRGVNYSKFTGIVMTTPRKKISTLEQTIGRVLRVNGPVGVIRRITFINDNCTVLRRQVENHVNLYTKRGYRITWIQK